MKAPYTIFGKTIDVPVVTVTDSKPDDPAKETWDQDLWVERGEDEYALLGLKGTTRVIYREEWLRALHESEKAA